MTFPLAMLVAALTGFISLSYEIVWFRMYSYVTEDSPAAFGVLLGCYLAGLAIGAFVSGTLCYEQRERGGRRQLQWLVGFVFLANLAGFLTVPVMAWVATSFMHFGISMLPVAGSAALFGAILPLVSHLGIAPDSEAGQRLALVYLANIIGSAGGSLVTGFVLSDVWTTSQIVLALALMGLMVVLLLVVAMRPAARTVIAGGTLLAASAVAFVLVTPHAFDRLYEKLQYKKGYTGQRFADLVENRHGVIAVTDDSLTYGGGAYDGRIATHLVDDRNIITRAYAVVALHPAPRQVLMIGLSTGAWAQVIANMPQVEHLTIVEINPGYLGLIRKYAPVASLLANPKVDIVIDDGRRWLLHHPERRFDVVVQNTTWHFRAHATNLLSREYLELTRAHLRPGGVVHLNTTWSQDAMKTAFSVFPYGLRMVNFVAVSDAPVHFDHDRWMASLRQFRIDGTPVLDLARATDRAVLDTLAALPATVAAPHTVNGLETREGVLARIPDARIVTDDNMLPEWHTLLLDH